MKTETANELLEMVREIVRAGNANTRAAKELMRQTGTGWSKRARELIAKAQKENFLDGTSK